MGSYISIGLVFPINKKESFSYLFKDLMDFISEEGKEIYYKYSKDEMGECWIDSYVNNSNITKLNLQQWITGYYQEMFIYTRLIDKNSQKLSIRVVEESDYIGILIDINEEIVKRVGYVDFENIVIELLEELYRITCYDYAFCEHEGEIEKSLNDILNKVNESYSIIALPMEGSLSIIKSKWSLDGITPRNK